MDFPVCKRVFEFDSLRFEEGVLQTKSFEGGFQTKLFDGQETKCNHLQAKALLPGDNKLNDSNLHTFLQFSLLELESGILFGVVGCVRIQGI